MPLYSYYCPKCDQSLDVYHGMDAIYEDHECPECGGPLKRVIVPIHHFWPSNYAPGMETSGQRMLLDPDNQARWKDEYAEKKALRKEAGIDE